MATLIRGKKTIDLPDNTPIHDAAKKLRVPFSCRAGACGSCEIEILEGAENLSPLSEAEEWMGCDNTHRLACQCTITKGTLKFKKA